MWARERRVMWAQLNAFTFERLGVGCDLSWLTLTSPDTATQSTLSKDFKAFLRRVEATFKIEVSFYYVFTRESRGGVIHAVLGLLSDGQRVTYIPHAWIVKAWFKIRGAYIVHINSIARGDDRHRRNTISYMVNQYMADQAAVIRHGYSYKKCRVSFTRAWKQFSTLARADRDFNYYTIRPAWWSDEFESMTGRRWKQRSYFRWQPGELAAAWRCLLLDGHAELRGRGYRISQREVVEFSLLRGGDGS